MDRDAGTAPPCPAGRRRIPGAIWEASVEARRLIESAGARAEALLAQARAEAEGVRSAAFAAAREEGQASVSELLARAAATRDRHLAEAQDELVALAFAVASSVLTRAVERDPEAVLEAAARALEEARQRTDVTLRVHPDDLAVVRAAEPRLAAALLRTRCVALVGDAAVERGGAVVETEVGTIDARLVTQLEGLRRGLEAALR